MSLIHPIMSLILPLMSYIRPFHYFFVFTAYDETFVYKLLAFTHHSKVRAENLHKYYSEIPFHFSDSRRGRV
jgi:hypothetical protein